MKQHKIAVLLYLQSGYKPEEVTTALNRMKQINGVLQVSPTSSLKQTMFVEYDPASTSGSEIVAAIKNAGHRACIVGM